MSGGTCRLLLAGASVLAVIGSQPALAQVAAQTAVLAPDAPAQGDGAQLEEIVVTAQKRSENLQSVPVSVTAFTANSLEARGVTSLLDVAGLAPSLSLPVQNGVVLPFLRGIGNSANNPGNEGSVAVYVDGVYFTRLSSGFFSLSNIERVEVLKGPQGTLFGRNASGGVVQIITQDPSHDFGGKAHIGYGNYNTLTGDLYMTTGLGDQAAIDLSVAGRRQGDGYGINRATGNRANYHDDFIVRSKLLIEPSDRTKIVLSGFYAYSNSSAQDSFVPGTSQGYQSAPFDRATPNAFYDVNSDIDPHSRQQTWGGSIKLKQDLGFAEFSSISAYLHDKEDLLFDLDNGPRADGYGQFPVSINQYTQEFQLANSARSGIQWILGLFYYNTTTKIDALNFQGRQFFPGDVLGDSDLNELRLGARQVAKSYAGFAQASAEVLPKVKLTAGLRYTKDDLRGTGSTAITLSNAQVASFPSAPGKYNDNKLTFRTAVDYQVADDAMIFGSFSRGYKSGVFNLLGFDPNATKPEVVDAYEIGLKSELFDRRLRFNISAFWYDIKNPQVQLLIGNVTVLANAQKARTRGVEFDGLVRVTNGLTIDFGATVLDSTYRRYLGAPDGPINLLPPYGSVNPLRSIDASGNRTPYGAKFTAHLGAQYNVQTSIGQITASADYNYNSGNYFEPNNFLRQPPYHMVNSQLTLKPNDSFSVSVWSRNIANEKILSYAGTQVGATGYPYIPAAPRTWGTTAGVNF
ncbi:TonB-dependent receptor [Rhizorhapis suberifaciens]|uniref:Iron complex outermembrane receptor protein n=1 Tax=Rhizorhapis suberifaciens TaxID=13656 RepID=A0A840HYQ3_9SPHN|nr:TonB-dependent receptor [Rhizorhapis suberifaciens]MBB4642546.1 iron complex outermembrane receptor protein [Rhizorhapis suberifaciens]